MSLGTGGRGDGEKERSNTYHALAIEELLGENRGQAA